MSVSIDSLVDKVRLTGVGCYISHLCVSIFLYADDILLISPSVSALPNTDFTQCLRVSYELVYGRRIVLLTKC